MKPMHTATADAIKHWKDKRNAIILAHYYQYPEIQDIADFVGDSLELARTARDTQADVIVFCGVKFMAETAKMLNPNKTVLLPVAVAGCPMADMITAQDILQLRAAHPQAAVMCYVNSNADVKAVSDICCTSANALRIAKSLPEKEIIFVPDQGLGGYIARALPEKQFILAQGYCPVHWHITAQDVIAFREAHPHAPVLIHPECNENVLALADFVGSTSQIIRKAQESPSEEFLIITEAGVLHQLGKLCPQKRFFSLDGGKALCPDMKKTQLADVLAALANLQHDITVDAELAKKALPSLERMFAVPA